MPEEYQDKAGKYRNTIQLDCYDSFVFYKLHNVNNPDAPILNVSDLPNEAAKRYVHDFKNAAGAIIGSIKDMDLSDHDKVEAIASIYDRALRAITELTIVEIHGIEEA